jgi:hypothetical protein
MYLSAIANSGFNFQESRKRETKHLPLRGLAKILTDLGHLMIFGHFRSLKPVFSRCERNFFELIRSFLKCFSYKLFRENGPFSSESLSSPIYSHAIGKIMYKMKMFWIMVCQLMHNRFKILIILLGGYLCLIY